MDTPVNTRGNRHQPLCTVTESAPPDPALRKPGGPAPSGPARARRVRSSKRRRRQWGSDRHSRPLLTVPKPASDSVTASPVASSIQLAVADTNPAGAPVLGALPGT